MATYGIDLGTTNSCIAYVDHTGRPVVLKSAIGEETTPSVVYFESPDNVVVGRQAKDTALLAPHLVVSWSSGRWARTFTTPSTGRTTRRNRSRP